MRYLVVVVCLLLAGCSRQPPEYVSHYTGPATTTAPQHAPFDVATINAALRTDKPYSIAVLGDSTGNEPTEWVHLTAKRIANDYGRQVTVHDWADEPNAYGPVTVYGSGPEVTIWNASGPGRSAQWSIAGFNGMVPTPVDVTFINHGHNNPVEAVAGINKLVNLSYEKGTGGVVILLQNPRIDDPTRAKLEAKTYKNIGKSFSNPTKGAVVVDVFDAFPPDPAPLLRVDKVHPNDDGQRLWADTVAAALQLA